MARRSILLGILSSVFAFSVCHRACALPEDRIAVYLTGEDLAKTCRSFLLLTQSNFSTRSTQEAYDAAFCQAYIEGILDTFSFQGDDPPGANQNLLPPFCIPDQGISAATITEVVARYVEIHPEQRHKSAYSLTRRALAQNYPC